MESLRWTEYKLYTASREKQTLPNTHDLRSNGQCSSSAVPAYCAQSLFSQRVALNVTHGQRVFNASPCDSVFLGLHDFMHRDLAAVAEGAASNYSADLPGSPCPKFVF